MKKANRVLATVLVIFTLLGSVLSVGIPAAADESSGISGRMFFSSKLGEEKFDEFYACLRDGMMENTASVDVSDFGLRVADSGTVAALTTLTYNEIPECFHMGSLRVLYNSSTGILSKCEFTYRYDNDTYQQMLLEARLSANALVEDLLHDTTLTDAQKVALVHDRLAVLCEYDSTAENKDNAYGALVDHQVTCMGYSISFMYLMDRLNIDCYYCISEELNHAWDIVKVDGELYHVDVTWDDPLPDYTGYVTHDYLLKSTETFKNEGHLSKNDDTIDYIDLPDDTRYEDAYWESSHTEIQYVNGELYYVDTNASALKRYDESGSTRLLNLPSVWNRATGNYTSLSSASDFLLYSTPDQIYEYDPETGRSNSVFAPDLSAGTADSVFGFTYRDGYLICDLFDSQEYRNGADEPTEVRKPYHASELIEDNGVYYYYEDGVRTDVTGLYTISGERCYIVNGIWQSDANTVIEYDDSNWIHIKNGKVDLLEAPTLVEYNGLLYYARNGLVDLLADTLVTYNGGLYHVKNGFVNTTEGDLLYRFGEELYYVQNGRVNTQSETLANFSGTWYYIRDGKVNYDTTLCYFDNSLFYVSDGVLDWTAETLIKYNGIWYHVKGGRVNPSEAPTLCNFANTWFYVKNGQVDWNADTLVKYDGVWYHVRGGSVNLTEAPTLTKYGDTWFYVKNGQVDWNADTLVKYNGVWFHVKGGSVHFSEPESLAKYGSTWYYVKNGKWLDNANTLVKYNNVWFHVKNGSVHFSEAPTLCKYGSTWFYVKGGQVDWNSDTLVKYNGVWFHVKGGSVHFSEAPTLTKYNGAWYYVKGGQVDWNSETLVKYNGAWFYVKGGQPGWNANTLVKYNGTWYCVTGGTVAWNFTGTVRWGNSYYRVVKGVVR